MARKEFRVVTTVEVLDEDGPVGGSQTFTVSGISSLKRDKLLGKIFRLFKAVRKSGDTVEPHNLF